MSREPPQLLDDIRESCRKIILYTDGMSFTEFVGDPRTSDAVVRNLEVIGQAVKRLTPEWRRDHPSIEWRKIAGLRDMLIHVYFGIDLEIVWDVPSLGGPGKANIAVPAATTAKPLMARKASSKRPRTPMRPSGEMVLSRPIRSPTGGHRHRA